MFDLDQKGKGRSPASDQAHKPGSTGRSRRNSWGRAPVDAATMRTAILDKLARQVGQDPETATERDWFMATALAVRDQIVDIWSPADAVGEGAKKVGYLSMEFLIGRLLSEALGNLGLMPAVEEALSELGVSFDAVRAAETDPALGNGGLGRLAACFMESMATNDIRAVGYGIRYDYGLFKQSFRSGWQQEAPDDWKAAGNPWEFERSRLVYPVRFGGTVEEHVSVDGSTEHLWRPEETVLAIAYDTPVVGWRGKRVNTLRLWAARSPDPLRLDAFNGGDHVGAQASQSRAEAISRVLYPSDATPEGHELRLRQEFFFTSASLQDLLQAHLIEHGSLASLPDHAAIQLNDTHPAIAVAELMRLLVDEHGFAWGEAWRITTATLNYTNHTLLPEALETWPVALMERLLPRHMQIIYLINWLQLQDRGAESPEGLAALSIIDESHGRRVRMGHLAFIGAHKVNGVSALHTDLMRQTVFRNLHGAYPGKIVNKTNGITVRRWFHQANPGLRDLAVSAVGDRVLDDINELRRLEPLASDRSFQERFAAERRRNKEKLARLVRERLDLTVDPAALFDIQVKRIHEYKRQLLNILETVALYQAMRAEPNRPWAPRVKVFAGKAAPSYAKAKLIIKLANDVAQVVNADPMIRDRLKVAFLPNYNVSLAEAIMPAADLSEQISTAGLEASGTGNMKFALNGALTIGTLDGANVEISEHVGLDNIFIFGLKAHEVEAHRREGFEGWRAVDGSPRLANVLAAIGSGAFSPDEPARFAGLVDGVRGFDPYMLAADFEAYWATQRSVDDLWRNPDAWWAKSILNTARMGWFSSDRTIQDYAREVWRVV